MPLLAFLATLAPAQQPAVDFVPLFDGRSLDGWHGDPRYWSVEDGAIVGRSTAALPCTRNTYLVRDGVTIADFELRFSFRIDGGNSGVQYRSADLGDFRVRGYQADLEAGASYTGILYEEQGRGILAQRGQQIAIAADGQRTERGARWSSDALQATLRPGDWNDYVVWAVGPRVVHEINGHTFVDVVDEHPGALRSGAIALQLHQGPPMEVRYRDLRYRPLPADFAIPVRPLTAPPVVSGGAPEWIWSNASPRDGERAWLRRDFELDGAAAVAIEIVATCDNRFELSLDGDELARGEDWQRPVLRTVRRPVAPGRHQLLVAGRNEGGPAALLARLRFVRADGSRLELVTDSTWQASAEPPGDAAAWGPAHSFGPSAAPAGPWPDPLAPRTATPAEQLTIPAGYAVELVWSAQPGEGSLIAMGFEPSGDLLVSVERSQLARLRLAGTSVVGYEPLDGTPRESQGFAFADGALWVQGVGDDGRGLYRLADADGDGRYERCELALALGSGGEHGAHAVVPGPDGALWLMNGNMSARPRTFAADSPFRHGAEDVLLPTLEDPRGHANGVHAPGGHLLRWVPGADAPQLVAAGFRNAYDVGISPDGELFTFDADMEWDLGLPWYRPTRVVHVVPGGEYGWRTGAAKWPTAYCDSLPPVVDVGLSSPTGVLFDDRGFAPFPGRAVLLGDWAYGRILAVPLVPDGSGSFADRGFVPLATGKPLNVTDLAFRGDERALWFVTGGRGTQSGLYRMTRTAAAEPGLPGAWNDPGLAARRALERPDVDVDSAWRELARPERFVRFAARVALERAAPAVWRARALGETAEPRASHALLALARVGDDADRRAVLDRLCALVARDGTLGVDRLRTTAVALARLAAPPDDTLRTRLLDLLDPRYPAGDAVADRTLLELLVALGAPDVVDRALAVAETADLAAALHPAHALRLVETGWSEPARRRYFALLGRAKALEGGLSLRGYVDAIESAALERAPAELRDELRALAAAPEPVRPDLTALRAAGTHLWTVAELLPALPEVGRGRDFAAGRRAFETCACVACHRFAGAGGDLGPDLTAVGSRYARGDLLRAILEPSADVPDVYRYTTLTLRDGTTVVGRVLREDASRLEIAQGSYQDERRTVPLTDIVSRQASPVSPMPIALTAALPLDALLDLLAWLESGGNPNAPAFAR
ncbi:MAG: DUF1080 domain-containing protein [Planctomycetes bacterium]|nr:DUF1080 domain-containing protein [Planctomycetota bacterium]